MTDTEHRYRGGIWESRNQVEILSFIQPILPRRCRWSCVKMTHLISRRAKAGLEGSWVRRFCRGSRDEGRRWCCGTWAETQNPSCSASVVIADGTMVAKKEIRLYLTRYIYMPAVVCLSDMLLAIPSECTWLGKDCSFAVQEDNMRTEICVNVC